MFDKTFFQKYVLSDDMWFFCCGLSNRSRMIPLLIDSFLTEEQGVNRSHIHQKMLFKNIQAADIFLHNAFQFLKLYEVLNIVPNPKLQNIGFTLFENDF